LLNETVINSTFNATANTTATTGIATISEVQIVPALLALIGIIVAFYLAMRE